MMNVQQLMPVARTRLPDEILAERTYDSIFLSEMFEDAQTSGASDIYLRQHKDHETWKMSLVIEFSIHGEKHIYKVEEGALIADLFNRLKRISRCNLATVEDCQDKAFELASTKSRYRLSLMPTAFGEAFVIRQISSELPTLANSNLPQAIERDFLWALHQRQGLVLVTGPTGSGKSTTLQAGIMEIDRKKLEVLAIEDPVERIIPGVKHVPITEHVTWHKAIRSALRSAPKVILIGEIRDDESAGLAMEAAQTGHLVLSTLHTNSVSTTVDRLIEMGVRRSLLADNLLFITGQRLLQQICHECRRPGLIGFKRGEGCSNCSLGISGRIPLVEYCKKPSRASILNFDKDNFEKSELKASFGSEAERLVRKGLVDELELEISYG